MSKQQRSSSGRKLQLRARAERMERTRLRIVVAAVELHQTVGPLKTSISAIAERSGVERLTVYRHFPDEPSLFAACTAHYFAAHPPPDIQAWAQIGDPLIRFRKALGELYTYWRETQSMTATILRDAEAAPERIGAGLRDFHAAISEALAYGWRSRGHARRRLQAVIGHATSFHTWRSLVVEQRLTDTEAVDLMVGLMREISGR